MENVVNVNWLFNNLSHPDLIVLDASSVKVNFKNPLVDTPKIKGARFFNLKNNFTNLQSKFPNTICSPEQFEREVRELGVSNNSKLVIYDSLGVYFSPRVWWMFKLMGHKDVAVLDGGLPAWIKKGYPQEVNTSKNINLGDFKVKFNSRKIVSLDTVVKNVNTFGFNLIDARSSSRFSGLSEEPRKEIESGHIPNSLNIPYTSVLNNGHFKLKKDLELIFDELERDKSVVFSCGSGITACIVLLAYCLVKNNATSVFDGSWTEWAISHQLFK